MDSENVAQEIGKQWLQIGLAGTAAGAPTGVWSYNYFLDHSECIRSSIYSDICSGRLLEIAGIPFPSAATFSVAVSALAFGAVAGIVLLVGKLLQK